MSSTVETFKKNWAVLSQIATLIAGIIGTILVPPNVIEPIISTVQAKAFAVLVLAIISSMFLVLTRKYKGRKDILKWSVSTILFLILAIGSFFYFLAVVGNRTCLYARQRVPTGQVYTAKGTEYLAENPGLGCETLINDFGGKISDIWTEESIATSRLFLFGIYLTTFTFISLSVLSAVQLTAIAAKK